MSYLESSELFPQVIKAEAEAIIGDVT